MQRIDDKIVLHWSRGTSNTYYPYSLFSWVYCAVGINKVNIEQDERVKFNLYTSAQHIGEFDYKI